MTLQQNPSFKTYGKKIWQVNKCGRSGQQNTINPKTKTRWVNIILTDWARRHLCSLTSIPDLTPMSPLESTICWKPLGVCTRKQVSFVDDSLGKICVPIDPTKPHEFIVTRVPTLTDCINELGQGKVSNKEDGEVSTPQCLQPYMRYFQQFLKNLDLKRIRDLQKNKPQASEGMIDFW